MLCRPWGVCVSRDGHILVANRSNNRYYLTCTYSSTFNCHELYTFFRIEVYSKDGKFYHKFGESGQGNGQFDRPSGVECDSTNRVVIADKDNHRIQVFTVNGQWLITFGEKGHRVYDDTKK